MAQHVSLIKLAHLAAAKILQPGDIVIDATVGNGFDTLFLAQQVTASGTVYGFDIQASAIASTQQILIENNCLPQTRLICDDHANMLTNIESQHYRHVKIIMFNLGYLPGSDKTLITQKYSTLAALDAALQLLGFNGMISIIAYPGHKGGQQETDAVIHWSQSIDLKRYEVKTIVPAPENTKAPQLIMIQCLQGHG